MSSRVFRGLSWRLLDAAQALMWGNSSFTVLISLEPTRRYESSAYFIMELEGRFACRSDAATTYDGGPMTDPWALDNTGIDEGDSRDDVVDLGYMAALFKVVSYPIIYVVRKIYYSHFLHQCTVAHGIKRLCKVRRDQQDVIILVKH